MKNKNNNDFDERQKALSAKIYAETFGALAIALIFNIFIMEETYKWCEKFVDGASIILGVCLIYFVSRNGATGCLFGVKGVTTVSIAGPLIMLHASSINVWGAIKPVLQGREKLVAVRSGMLTHKFCMLIYWGLLIVYAAIFLIFAVREKNGAKSDKEGKQ